ncbi:unnamed protein product, partial [Ixodes hexagonus]
MTMQEFLEFQEKRHLVESESIVQYIYSKNAKLDMAPYTLAMEERISLILNGIKDDKWANPLAAQCCKTVIELIERAAMLDCRRRTEKPGTQAQQSKSTGKASTQRQTSESASTSVFKRPTSRQCFNC